MCLLYRPDSWPASVFSRSILFGAAPDGEVTEPDGAQTEVRPLARIRATGSVAPFETEYVTQEGGRVPVLVGMAAFDERGIEGLAFGDSPAQGAVVAQEFLAELDAVSQSTLDRGYRLVELLKQDLNSPLRVEEQVIVLYAGTQGFLDGIPVEDVKRYEGDLLAWFEARHRDILDGIRETGKIPSEDDLKAALQGFTDQFETTVSTEES